MNCPDCGHVLREASEHGLTAEVCGDCPGAWFRKGVFEQHLRMKYLDVGPLAVEKPADDDLQEETARSCPACPDSRLENGYLRGIIFAHCPQCDGLWLGKELIGQLDGGKAGEVWDCVRVLRVFLDPLLPF
mgnify:CR=1 FL=1